MSSAYLVPPDQLKLLFIGQDLKSVRDYRKNCSLCPDPGGIATYVNLAALGIKGHNGALGWTPKSAANELEISWGAGPLNAYRSLTENPQSALQIGLYLVDQLEMINAGKLNEEIDQLADFFNHFPQRPFYLRIGYEFDGNWNGYAPQPYKMAYRYLVDRLRQQNVNNVAYVWQSCTSPFDDAADGGLEDIMAYYPGDSYVDWFGLSWFLRPDDAIVNNGYTTRSQLFLAQQLVDLAAQKNKPVMIAEAANQGYNNQRLQRANIGPPLEGKPSENSIAKSAEDIWSEWYQPFFQFIDHNAAIIRAVTYINANWNTQPMWAPPYAAGYWGDSRIEANAELMNKWLLEINQPHWLHASAELSTLLKIYPHD